MALDYIGTQLKTGASETVGTWTNYILQSVTANGKNVEIEDVDDADGALATRIIFKRHPKIVVEAVCKNAADPSTDFPEGDMCALTGLTAYYVESAPVTKVKGAWKVTATLVLIGIT